MERFAGFLKRVWGMGGLAFEILEDVCGSVVLRGFGSRVSCAPRLQLCHDATQGCKACARLDSEGSRTPDKLFHSRGLKS